MNKKKTRKAKKDNIAILISSVILIGLVVTLFIMAKNIFGTTKVVKAEVVDKIEAYSYSLNDHNTKYYKELFNQLKEVLEKDNVDEEQYASLVAQMFTADFYDLNSKLSKNDVGGIQFIPDNYRATFTQKASSAEGIYYYVGSSTSSKKTQELPEVEDVEIISLKNTSYKHEQIDDSNAYQIVVKVTYKQSLGYPKTVNLTLAHNGNKIDVVEIH